jgi:hypothetical protein
MLNLNRLVRSFLLVPALSVVITRDAASALAADPVILRFLENRRRRISKRAIAQQWLTALHGKTLPVTLFGLRAV